MRKSISEHTFLDSRCPLLSFRGAVLFITLTLGSNQLQVRVFLSPTNVKSILGTGLFTGFSYMNRLLFISHSFSIDPLHLCIGSSFHFLEIGLITHSHELVHDKIISDCIVARLYVDIFPRCRPVRTHIPPANTMFPFQGLQCREVRLWDKARLQCKSRVKMHCAGRALHRAQGYQHCHHLRW